MTSLLIISWYKKLWIMYFCDAEQNRPQWRISAFIFRLSDCMQRNLWLRIVVYFVTIASYCVVAAMQVVRSSQRSFLLLLLLLQYNCFTLLSQMDCTRYTLEDEDVPEGTMLYYTFEERIQCFHPWVRNDGI